MRLGRDVGEERLVGEAGPRVEASARFALTTLSGVSDEVPLLLATVTATVLALPRQRALEQRVEVRRAPR